MKNIITTKEYWESINGGTRAYWRRLQRERKNMWICTHRPNRNISRETTLTGVVRRCSTGGRWGKSADTMVMDIPALVADRKFIFV